MAPIEHSTADEWPVEGLPLKEAVPRVVDPALLDAWRAACEDRQFAARRIIRRSSYMDDWRDDVARPAVSAWTARQATIRHAHDACFAPFIDAWNRDEFEVWGRRVPKGQRDDPFAARQLIPPPKVGWRFIVLNYDRSIIRDPRGGAIQGLLIRRRDAAPAADAAASLRRAETPTTPKEWLIAEVAQTPAPAPADRKHGWKRRYAEKLAEAMEKAAKTNKRIHPMIAASIVNRLSEWKLWPK